MAQGGAPTGTRPGPPAGSLPASGPARRGPPRPGCCCGPRSAGWRSWPRRRGRRSSAAPGTACGWEAVSLAASRGAPCSAGADPTLEAATGPSPGEASIPAAFHRLGSQQGRLAAAEAGGWPDAPWEAAAPGQSCVVSHGPGAWPPSTEGPCSSGPQPCSLQSPGRLVWLPSHLQTPTQESRPLLSSRSAAPRA